jgi:hypothetical protein
VKGLRLDELVVRSRAKPLGERPVERRAHALRKPAVRDVSDQHVPEPEGRLTGQRRERLARQQLSVDEVCERRVDVERRVELEDRATPEHAADQGTVAEDRAGSRRERVDARGDQRLQRVRDPHGGALALLDQHSDRLLDEQRVPFGLLEEDAAKPVGQRRPLDEGVHELGRLRVGQRRELDRDRAAPAPSPAGPRIEQLGASEADD